jgi:hypothetical protein
MPLLASSPGWGYVKSMILIRFPNAESKKHALGSLAGRFAFKSWASGEMLVPEDALAYLAVQGIAFAVEGPATYEQNGPAFRGSPAAAS